MKVRMFESYEDALGYKEMVCQKFGLPRYYSQADLDSGVLQQVGSGRHVPPEQIIRDPVPHILVGAGGVVYAVEATADEINDPELSSLLVEGGSEWEEDTL